MFPNLNAEMARQKLTIKALSELSGINYESLKNKVNGTTEFKRCISCMKQKSRLLRKRSRRL